MLKFIVKMGLMLILISFLNQTHAQVSAGDIAVIGMNSGPNSGTAAHNDEFAIVALADLPGSAQIFLTDFGSDGSGLATGNAFDHLEGIITWTTPAVGVDAGTVLVFTIPNGTNNLSVSPNLGTFSVSGWTSTSANGSPINNGTGDNIFVFTGSVASPTFIYGFVNSSTLGSPSATEDWHTSTGSPQASQLPSSLLNSDGTNVATAHAMNSTLHKDNMVYTGTYSGTKDEILRAIGNPSNWATDDVNLVDLSVGGSRFSGVNPVFTITQPTPVIGTTTFDDLGYGIGPSFTVLADEGTGPTGTGPGAGLMASATNQSGWDIDVKTTAAAINLRIQGDGANGFGGSASVNILVSKMDYVSFKSTDGADFKLNSFYFRALAGSPLNNVSYTVTGYLDGNMVNGATAIGVITGNTLTEIPITANAFNQVDEFRIMAVNQGGSTAASNMRFDHITIEAASIPAPTQAVVAAKIFLEGAFNGTNLNTTLNSSIPSSQPYSGSNFNNHTGTENGSVPVGAVDWVLVELREAASASLALNSTKVGSTAGFLMSDGSIKTVNGVDNLNIPLSGNSGDEFFVVVYHRNHLPIMSATAISESGGTYTIDFTSLAANTFENTDALVSLASGKFAMPAGDTDADGDIDATDINTWKSSNGVNFVYNSSGLADFNLDGVINAVDRNDFQRKNNLKERKVPTN